MNEAAKRAIQNELSNVEDNLYRYKHFGKPTDTTGNGETYASIIEQLEIQRGELRDALREVSP